MEHSCRGVATKILPWMYIFNIGTTKIIMDMTTSRRCFCNKGLLQLQLDSVAKVILTATKQRCFYNMGHFKIAIRILLE